MTGHKDDAVKEFQRALELDNQDPSTHFHLAKLYQSMGRTDEAKAEFSAASKLNRQANEALTRKISEPPSPAHP